MDDELMPDGPMPTVDSVIGKGALYFWDAGHMGYSYWMLDYGKEDNLQAFELLPKGLDPRIKSAHEVAKSAEYQRVLTPTEIDAWRAVISGAAETPYRVPHPAAPD